MDFLTCFVSDVFDVDADAEFVKQFVDEENNTLKLGDMLRSPLLARNLLFGHLWKNVTGVYPSKQHYANFKNIHGQHPDISAKSYTAFLKMQIPIYNYVQVNTEHVEKLINEAKHKYTLAQAVKEQLVEKFTTRFGVNIWEINPKEQILKVYKACVFHDLALKRISQINEFLSQRLHKPLFEWPEKHTNFQAYFSSSMKLIEHYGLQYINVYNWSYNGDIRLTSKKNTIFDIINYTSSSDASFFRTLFGAISIYWHSGDFQSNRRLGYLIDACNNKDTKPIIVFTASMHQSIEKSNTYLMHYHLLDDFLIHFVPKVCSHHILLSSSTFVPYKSLAPNNQNSIVFSTAEDNSKPLEVYLHTFNRYLTNSIDNVYNIANDVAPLKVYVLADIDTEAHELPSHDLIYNEEFIEHQWNAHLTTSCPFRALARQEYNTKQNVLLYDQFLLRYYLENKKILDTTTFQQGCKNAVVVVDNRPNIFSSIALNLTMMNVDQSQWSPVVVSNETHIGFYKRFLKGNNVQYITLESLPVKKFSIDIYNDLLKSTQFWDLFKDYDRILFVQDDGMILKKGVEEFCKYDYVGAPWQKAWATENPNKFIYENVSNELVGNGGVSLRNVDAMRRLCVKYNHISKQLHYDKLQQQPEDVFFSYCCKKEGLKTPSYDIAQTFAVEQVYNTEALGFHKPWPYHEVSVIQNLFNNYLQTHKL